MELIAEHEKLADDIMTRLEAGIVPVEPPQTYWRKLLSCVSECLDAAPDTYCPDRDLQEILNLLAEKSGVKAPDVSEQRKLQTTTKTLAALETICQKYAGKLRSPKLILPPAPEPKNISRLIAATKPIGALPSDMRIHGDRLVLVDKKRKEEISVPWEKFAADADTELIGTQYRGINVLFDPRYHDLLKEIQYFFKTGEIPVAPVPRQTGIGKGCSTSVAVILLAVFLVIFLIM